MSAFLDTNILIYAQQTGPKADQSRALLAQGGKLSVQVLNEFTAVARCKLQHDWDDISDAISDILTVLDPPLALTFELHVLARTLAEENRLSFYDALIVAAAIEAGCATVYSEDMQHGRAIGGVRIINPFVERTA
ncbi:PIN domain-containing protein [Bradyrhizobium sp. Ai1a-2]|uniref:PIN domain-containing protein n=1 Tax=Bradyrhizobium sp. Ai1a-2 TaxID=196490 RepID=UPI00040C6366|nr:PIN domain-containing protein [Bradyrhizobium sp. Ai1a-2]